MHLGLGNSQKAKRFRKFVTRSSTKFDGTDGYVDTGFQPDFIHTNATMSYWVKMGDLSGAQLCGTHNAKRFYLGLYNATAGMGVQNQNNLGSGADLSSFLKVDQWHHIAMVAEGGTATFYLDGIARDTLSYTQNSANNPSANLYIGGISNSGSAQDFMNASIDEFAVFSSALTAREVDALYNNGQPTKIRTNPNLANWFRMGEGKLGPKSDGDSNILFQGLPTTFGSELITNGDFSSASGWTLDSNASVSGGKLVLASSSGISYQTIDLDNGAAYEVTFTIENFTSGTVKAYLNGTNGTVRSANGTYTEVIIAGSSNTLVGINPSGTMDIDNFSLKKLTNVGTLVNSPEIQADGGSELIVNGTFDSNVTSWPASSSGTVTWSNGTAITGAVGTDDRGGMSQTFTTVNGRNYTLSFSVISRTSTKWEVYRQGTGPGTIIEGTDLGSHKITFTAASNSTELAFYAKQAGTSDGTVAWDNISVKEVTESVPKQCKNLPSAASLKSLSFDGTDDVVDLGASSTFFSGNVNSISMWFKMPDTSGGEERIFVSNSDAGSSDLRVVVSTSGIISVDIWNGSSLVSTTGGSAIDDDLWHHLVYTTNASAQALYIDGVSVATTTHTRSSRAGSVSATIGAYVTGNQYAEVDADEVAIWDTVLDADAVKALYNAGLPTPVTTKTGAYDIYRDNLKAYYKMGDASDPAADGTSNLLFDQTNPGVGSELVTNGDFSDDSVPDTYDGSSAVNLVGWTSGGATFTADAHFVITDGKCRLISDGTNTVINSGTVVVGKTYQYSIDVTDVTTGGLTLIGGGHVLEANATSPGTYTGFYTATATGAISINRQSGVTDFTFDNVSVKEVNGHTGTISGATIQTEAPKAIYALPPLDNSKSLNFDGSNDYLDLGASSNFFATNINTISFWFKIGDTSSAEERIFVSNSDAGGSDLRIVVATSGKITVDFWNGSSLSSTTGGPVVDDSEWHHLVFTTTASAQALYIDGASVATTTHTRSSRAGSVSATVAAHVSSAVYAPMSADELSIWGVALSAENVRALYNRGRPIDISKSQGAYDQGANLLHWWRMGDATSPAADGTNDIIFQGLEFEGDEMFPSNASSSDWAQLSQMAWDGSTLSITDSSGTAISGYELVLPVGATFRLTFDVTNDGTGNVYARIGDGLNTIPISNITTGSYGGVHTVTETGHNNRITFITNGNFAGTITNISVTRIRGQYSGAELMKADDNLYIASRWFIYTGGSSSPVASYPNGTAARFTNPAAGGWNQGGRIFLTSGSGTHALTENMETGCVYKLTFDFQTDDSDAVPSYHDGTSATSLPAGSGSKTFYFAYSGSASTRLEAANVSASKFVEFSKLSLTKVGGAAVMTNMDSASDIQTDTPY